MTVEAELQRGAWEPSRARTGREYPSIPGPGVFAALEASPLPTTFVTPDLVYRFVNRSYERWFGLRWEEAVGRTLEQVIGKAAAETVLPFARTALQGATVQFESTLPYLNRGPRRMRVTYAATAGPDGEPAGFFAFLEDVTATFDAESAVNAALDGLGDAYFTLDRQMRFTYVNEAAATLYGIPARKMVGRHIDAVLPGASRSPTGMLLAEVLETRRPARRALPSVAFGDDEVFLWEIVPLLTGGAGVVLQRIAEPAG